MNLPLAGGHFAAQTSSDPDLLRRWAKFETVRPHVSKVMQAIRDLSPQSRMDEAFLEHEFIPFLGLNDEHLHEQPPELKPSFGAGLHLWQYPNQLASYLAWIARNVRDVAAYAEIGSRWGGMTILVSEWLRADNPLRKIIAIDPVGMTPLLQEYFTLLQAAGEVEPVFVRDFSTSPGVQMLLTQLRPEMVFIDGDHMIRGALFDHMLVRGFARYIVHHDVASDACETTTLWRWLKDLESRAFDPIEFTQQYASVQGSFLGIGAMTRQAP